MSDTEAFLDHNFAPPMLRRRIGILGFIHKRVLCQCHPLLQDFLPMSQERDYGVAYLHDRQLLSNLEQVSCNHRMIWRSLWSYICIYNRLPQDCVNEASVQRFQSRLTHFVKVRALAGDPTWRNAYQDCADVLRYFH